jgi:cyanophycinase
VDAYEGTQAEKLLHDVLKRGGVIGGSSAGASIQGEYLARGNPLGPQEIIAPGYERGMGFLRGMAIDQHFSQRNRFRDMELLMRTYPQLLGVGIDEATAIVVQKASAEVVGRGKAHFYAGKPEFTALSEGERYDLTRRKAI